MIDFVAARFEEWGYEVEIAEYQVLFPSPRTRELELVAPYRYTACLAEDSLAEDASSSRIDNSLPPYNASSSDGDVEGKIAIARYGGS